MANVEGGMPMNAKSPMVQSIVATPAELATPFIDVVLVEAKPEVVILNFVQQAGLSEPGASGPTSQNRLAARVAVSWPHFARISRLLSQVYEQHKEAARQAFDEGVK